MPFRRSETAEIEVELIVPRLQKQDSLATSGLYALTNKVYCGQCGSEFKRVTWRRKRQGVDSVIIVWKCKKRHQKVFYCKDSHIIKEENLHEILHDGIRQSLSDLNKLNVNVAVNENIQSVLSQNEDLPRLTGQIAETRQQMDIFTPLSP